MAMMFSSDDSEIPDDEVGERLKDMFGPTAVDDTIRQALRICWMCLPEDKKTIDEVERQIRRIVDRAIQNAKDDGAVFGN